MSAVATKTTADRAAARAITPAGKRDAATDRALTTAQFARRFGITVHGTLALLDAGVLAGVDVRRPGSSRPRWRILPAAVESFMRDRASRPAPPAVKSRRRPATAKPPDYIEYV